MVTSAVTPMWKVVLHRIAAVVPTVLFGTVLIFLLVQVIPGGAAEEALGTEASAEAIEVMRERMGLNRPLHEQYFGWLASAARGDLGRSLTDQRNIAQAIVERLPLTIELTVVALALSLLIGIPLGVASAVNRSGRIDSAVTGISGLGLALPEFWLAMLAVNLFALKLGWFPATGVPPLELGVREHIQAMVLPSLTLASGAAAAIVRFTRSGMLEALGSSYVRTAWALGLRPWQVFFRFALKNALIPLVTVIGIIAASLFGGAVLVEQVFVIPGLGSMLVTAVLQKDFPTVQSVALVLTVVFVMISLVVDIGCAMLDPRTRR